MLHATETSMLNLKLIFNLIFNLKLKLMVFLTFRVLLYFYYALLHSFYNINLQHTKHGHPSS